MILLQFTSNEGIKAATIQKPDIKPLVIEVLSKTYKPDMAERYAGAVAEFFIETSEFPEDGIYRLDDEGKLHRFNLKKKSWDNNGKAKSEYVISLTSKFWKNFNKNFLYLASFWNQIYEVVRNVTEKMFDIPPVSCHFIGVEDNRFYIQETANYALEKVFTKYCTEEATKSLMRQLLQVVFNSTEIPVFIVTDNMPKIALTTSDVFTEIKIKKIDGFLSNHFAPEDVKKMAIRVKNSIIYGTDFDFEIISITSDGDIIFKFAGLQIRVVLSEDDSDIAYFELLNTTGNKEVIKSLGVNNVWDDEYEYLVTEGEITATVRVSDDPSSDISWDNGPILDFD